MRRAWRDAMPKGATVKNSKAAVGYNYCNKLFALERKWKNLNNAQREENRRNQAEKLVDEYFLWVYYIIMITFRRMLRRKRSIITP